MPKGNPDRDPLDDVLRPPLDETEEERLIRLQTEEKAKRVSDAIDEAIRRERQAAKKKDVVRLLLLGQSESGKSTTLKQFQRLYTPTAFREERHLWRCVIQLNIVRSIRLIVDTISDVHRNALLSEDESDGDEEFQLSDQLLAIKERLKPLRHIENILVTKLVPPNEAEATNLGTRPDIISSSQSRRDQEIFVRPGKGWHGALLRGARPSRPISAGNTGMETPDDTQYVLGSCRPDMIALWQNPTVRAILQRRKIRLEELPGFYLNELDRMTSLKYVPTDDDVLKARLKTVGVCEYKFRLEASAGSESGTEWRIIDVGGSRSQRPTWAQFFDAVNAILFLAPISSFDQALAEDRSVNRLEDSVLLWKSVCSNKLLANVELVLFLNKCDLLEAKLESGIRLAKYVRSFGDRSNDLDTATKYFRGKFSAILREHSPHPRKFYGFCTSVTDTSTTAGILAIVRDIVVREHLKKTRLL